MTAYQSIPVENLPFLYINGMVVSNNATTPNSKVDVSSGQCRDSNDVMDISLSAAVTINAGANGAVNRLDAGTFAASKVYGVYVIGDSSNKLQAGGLLSLASNSSPLLPFGYDSYRLVGYAISDASIHFLLAYISGINSFRQYFYDAPQATAITAGASTSYAAIDLSALVPPVSNIPVSIKSALTPSAAGRGVFLQPVGATGDAIINLGQVTSVVLNSYNIVLAQLSSSLPKINYKVSNGSDAVAINVAGFQFVV